MSETLQSREAQHGLLRKKGGGEQKEADEEKNLEKVADTFTLPDS